jgi:D-aspartate ligase
MRRSVTPNPLPGAIVVGGYANGLGVVRSLAARGIEVAVIRTQRQDMAHLSRDVAESDSLADFAADPGSLLTLLEARAARWHGRVVIPTNDQALEVLSREHERLNRAFRLAVPPWEVAARVLDKAVTLRAAMAVGIAVPHSYGPAEPGNPRLTEVAFPALVKPIRTSGFVERFGRKLLLVRTAAELHEAVHRVVEAGIACEVLDLVPGPDPLHVTYDAYRTASGEIVGDWARRKLRQSPPFFGVARAAEPVDVPELKEPTHALLHHLEWQGLASVCYKQDPRTGRYCLMEVNGRCPQTNALASRAGVDTPYMIYSGALSGKPEGIKPNGWRGVWIHLHADLLYTAFHAREERLDWGEFWRSYRGPKVFAVWSLRDPRPFLAEWGHTARKALRPGERRRMLSRVQAIPPQEAPAEGALG